jgi:hypothetical protein
MTAMKRIAIAAVLSLAAVAAHASVIGAINTVNQEGQPAGQQLFFDDTCDDVAIHVPSDPVASFLRGKTSQYLVAQMDANGTATFYGCYTRTGYSAVTSWQDGTTQVRVVPWMK